MMVYIGIGGLAGVAIFGALYIVFFLKGVSLKLPLLGMATCMVVVAVAAVLLNLPGKDSEDPDASGAPSQEEHEEPTGQTSAAPDGTSMAEQVLLDKRGLVITTAGFDGNGIFGPELKLLIENHSDSDVIIQLRNPSVNGYMADTVCSIEADAGKRTEDSITFLASSLQRCGIETIADMEFTFHVIDSHRNIFLESEPARAVTSAADTYQYRFDDSGEELYSGDGVRIVSRGISQDEGGAVLFMENAREDTITVQIRDVSVNGVQMDSIFSQDISADKRSVYPVALPSSLLTQNGIQEISQMGFTIHVVEQVGQAAVLDTGPLTVQAG